MNRSKENNILLLGDPQVDPPPNTDMFFSERALLRTNQIDTPKFGIAVGLGWGVIFVFMSIIALITTHGAGLAFFKDIYPGFNPSAIYGVFVGFVWSVVYGFVFGIIIGVLYNSLVRKDVLENENLETYA
ncbi:MAG: hypothetical protein ACFFDN_37340 [Candidatus Hodarchaeota archaeon]